MTTGPSSLGRLFVDTAARSPNETAILEVPGWAIPSLGRTVCSVALATLLAACSVSHVTAGNGGSGGTAGGSAGSGQGGDGIDLESGLLSHWSFDEGTGNIANDSMSGIALVRIGAAWDSEGVVGGAVELDGVDDYFEVQSPGAPLDVGTGDFTIAAWIKSRNFGALDARPQHIAGRGLGDGNIQPGYRLYFGWNEAKSHNLQLRIADGEASSVTALVNAGFYDARAGDWIMVAGLRRGDELRVYSDGVLYDRLTGAITTDIDVEGEFNDIFRVGALPFMAHHPFDGWVDELRVYTRALSDAEIAALAQPPQ